MEFWLQLAATLGLIGIMIGVPLSILRSLDEIKASQRRIETQLAELEAHLAERERVG